MKIYYKLKLKVLIKIVSIVSDSVMKEIKKLLKEGCNSGLILALFKIGSGLKEYEEILKFKYEYM
jgi:hypothetical protein